MKVVLELFCHSSEKLTASGSGGSLHGGIKAKPKSPSKVPT